MPAHKKKQKKTSFKQHVQGYMQQLSHYKKTFHRAFKVPKRLVMSGEHPTHFFDKIKTLIQKTPLAMWVFVGSLGFLFYALGYASNSTAKQEPKDFMHQASKIAQDAGLEKTEEVADISETQTLVDEKQIDTTDIGGRTQEPETIQLVYSLFDSINDGSYVIGDYFDSYMKTSNLVQSYFTTAKLAKFRQALVGDVVVENAEEFETDRSDRIGVNYTISYTLATTNQSFQETRNVTLRPQSGGWRIGTFRCESRGCSVNPFFNPEKYGIK